MTATVRKKTQQAVFARAKSDMRADYRMSRESEFVRQRTGLAPQGGTADYHYRTESYYYRDIEKARDMDRNDAVVGQTVDRAVANIVQDGFTLDTKTGDRSIDADLLARWNEWAGDCDACDISGEFTWHDLERHAMRSMLLDGDIVSLGLKTGQLQMIEAHAIQTTTTRPNTFLGVELSSNRKRLNYYVMQDAITPNKQKKQAIPVPVRDLKDGTRILFHIYNPKRITQTRGVTAFAPIFEISGMLEDINFAKVIQQQIVSCFAIFRKQEFTSSGNELPSTSNGYGDARTETLSDGSVRQLEGIAPGMEITGRPGEELQGFSPNVPNAEYFQQYRQLLQLVGANLGLPLCLVLMDGSETNFSGWRGAVDEARKGFRTNQTNLMNRFHAPVFRWKVRQWIQEDRALRSVQDVPGIDLFGHRWNAPKWQYIDPYKDAQADAFQIQNALTSPRRLHNDRGRDWDEVNQEIVDDNLLAIQRAKEAAIKINKELKDGQPVHWRELISLPMPNGLQMQMSDPNKNVIEGTNE